MIEPYPLPRLVPLLAALLTGPVLAQISNPAPTYFFSHLAGTPGGYGNADGTGVAARFWNPSGVAVDSSGNIFVTDFSNNSLRRITPVGAVTTVLTAADINRLLPAISRPVFLNGLVSDASDNLFLSETDSGLILKLTSAGVLSIYAGQTGVRLGMGTDGTLAQASFYDPSGMAFDSSGNFYVADPSDQVIRRITPSGQVSTYAGTPPAFGSPQGAGVDRSKRFPGNADGPALSAQFFNPNAVATDAAGNLYVADTQNHTIRKVAPDGQVTTFAGKATEQGSVDGIGDTARFRFPNGVAVDAAGNIYVADTGNGTIRRIAPGGAVTTLAGSAGDYRGVDGAGAAARFVAPKGLVFDRKGNRLLVGDGASLFSLYDQAGTVRQVTSAGVVTTLAGQAGATGGSDGKGDAARFRRPAGLAVDLAGNAFVADDLNHTIRRIAPDGTTTTLAGTPGVAGKADGPGTVATFSRPVALTFSGSDLIVADHDNHLIRRVTLDGFVTTIAGQAGVAGTNDGLGTAASFHNPVAVAADGAGNIYVGDGDYFPGSGDPARQFGTIRKISPRGEVSTLAGSPVIVPYEMTRYNPDGIGADARFGDPTGLTFGNDGNIYVADYSMGRIRQVTPAGMVTSLPLVDGSGAEVTLLAPTGIARDRSGNLFVTQGNNQHSSLLFDARIFRITPASVTTIVAGTAGVIGSNDGIGRDTQFNNPTGIAIDFADTLYVADTDNSAIRKGIVAGPPVITTQPQSQTLSAGTGAQFGVGATGIPTPTYQWYFNGSPYNGATTNTLSFTNARSTDAGDYTVVVTNSLGSVTSNKATLTVTSASAPAPAPAGGGGGGGSIGAWFALALLALGATRLLVSNPARLAR